MIDEIEKPEPTRIVFLDMDGPMCSSRAVMASGAQNQTKYIDPVAIGFLNQLYMAAPYWIVITSSWRKETEMPILLASCGVLAPCHKDWATPTDIVVGARTSMDDRPYQINKWLEEHDYLKEFTSLGFAPKEGVECLIIDDDQFNWTWYQRASWIKADAHDGIPLKSMQQAFDLFEVPWPAENRAYPT